MQRFWLLCMYVYKRIKTVPLLTYVAPRQQMANVSINYVKIRITYVKMKHCYINSKKKWILCCNGYWIRIKILKSDEDNKLTCKTIT